MDRKSALNIKRWFDYRSMPTYISWPLAMKRNYLYKRTRLRRREICDQLCLRQTKGVAKFTIDCVI